MNSSSPSVHKPPSQGASPSEIEDAAILWLTERDDGFTSEREREFARWLCADPRHKDAVERIEQTLGLLGELPEFRVALNTEFNRAAPVVPFSSPAVAAPRRRSRVASIAWVGLAAALMVGVYFGARAWVPAGGTRYATTAAGYERAQLEDGTTLELNASSKAVVSFTGAQRRVELEAGEAHFAVAPDPARPFLVSAGSVSVRAVGTEFTVRYTLESVEVTVVEGKVRVAQREADPASAPLVVAGQRALVPREAPAPRIEPLASAALRERLSWQGKLAEFADAPLADVIVRFNARNRVQLVLGDPGLGVRRIGGTFALDEAEAFARLLTRDGEIVSESRGDSEIVLRRAP